jgi:tRNA nucleotidyltransferase (CCA-adding enzyme)
MGWESKDIDIALDNMKGEEYVLLLKKLAETKNEKISSFGVTKLNPDLSKHLETATAKIHNQAIDFVNLRSETYNNESRIPTIVCL